jgi:hypothetical protein
MSTAIAMLLLPKLLTVMHLPKMIIATFTWDVYHTQITWQSAGAKDYPILSKLLTSVTPNPLVQTPGYFVLHGSG